MKLLQYVGDFFLFLTTLIVLCASLLITFQTRFIQFRKLPHMIRQFFLLIFRSRAKEGKETIRAHRALFTAMSTTIGISTIVSPVIAIRLGGPGAVLGFLIATILGAAVNFTEVTFALSYRKNHPTKGIAGGPMQYLHDAIHPFLAKWYAFFGFILLMGWSAAQANQLGEILNSPFFGDFRIPGWVTGVILAIMVTLIVVGGIKRVASFSAKLVPAMFLIYVLSSLWIIFLNVNKLPGICFTILDSALTPRAFAGGITVGGIMAALRWGVFKGLQSCEAGVGTQTIPHSMSETEDPVQQGILAMIATYSAGFICILSSFVALTTETWLDSSVSLGINMVAASFQHYFSTIGLVIVTVSAILFALGTILGNNYNGCQCFSFFTKNRFLAGYYVAAAILIFFGAISDVKMIWTFVDYLLILILLPHILSIVFLTYKQKSLLEIPQSFQ